MRSRPSIRRAIPAALLAAAALLLACAARPPHGAPQAVPELRPGLLVGYLTPEALPDSVALLPPPPAPGSLAQALDAQISGDALALRDTPAWSLAAADADLHFPHAAGTFSCALGAPISEADTPHLYQLLRRSLTDAGWATFAAKQYFARTRPFVTNHAPVCATDVTTPAESTQAYPSGHAAIGTAWGLILAELAPARGDAILVRARAFAVSRIVCNAHWHSDTVAGRFVGAATVARLHADPQFQADLAAARDELAAVRARGLPPPRDCAAEAAAIARQPTSVP